MPRTTDPACRRQGVVRCHMPTGGISTPPSSPLSPSRFWILGSPAAETAVQRVLTGRRSLSWPACPRLTVQATSYFGGTGEHSGHSAARDPRPDARTLYSRAGRHGR